MRPEERIKYLQSRVWGLEDENEKLREKNRTYYSYIAQMGVLLGFGAFALIVALWVMFNG